MTATRCTRIAVAALAAVVLSSMPALAGPWGPTGPADNFTYSNGQDINGCFGTPIVSGDTFYFLESNFQVNAANGTTDTKDDTVSVDLLANQNMQFSSMQVTAFGSYSLIGDGSQVNLNAGLTMHENAGLERTWSGPLMTEPAFPIAFGGRRSEQWCLERERTDRRDVRLSIAERQHPRVAVQHGARDSRAGRHC